MISKVKLKRISVGNHETHAAEEKHEGVLDGVLGAAENNKKVVAMTLAYHTLIVKLSTAKDKQAKKDHVKAPILTWPMGLSGRVVG